jgi:hypothetical protein
MARTNNRNLVLGVVLLAVGGILMATRLALLETTPAWLLGLGAALALIAIVTRGYGVLIGGMILLGLGAGMVLGDRGVGGLRAGTWTLIGLGAGFIGIYLMNLILQLKRHWWPLIPGLALLAVAGARYVRNFRLLPPEVLIALRTWWPAALVVVGLAMIIVAVRK